MKELSENIKENLETLLETEKSCAYKSTFCEEYLTSLSKQGYEVKEYKNRYFEILRERHE
tara:strand:- start:1486 stop:1665 length:180 start_codon:yes stop_codon:yes gene_type:complete